MGTLATAFYVVGGIACVIGVAFVIGGVAFKQKILVHSQFAARGANEISLQVVPVLTPRFAGLGAAIQF